MREIDFTGRIEAIKDKRNIELSAAKTEERARKRKEDANIIDLENWDDFSDISDYIRRFKSWNIRSGIEPIRKTSLVSPAVTSMHHTIGCRTGLTYGRCKLQTVKPAVTENISIYPIIGPKAVWWTVTNHVGGYELCGADPGSQKFNGSVTVGSAGSDISGENSYGRMSSGLYIDTPPYLIESELKRVLPGVSLYETNEFIDTSRLSAPLSNLVSVDVILDKVALLSVDLGLDPSTF